MWKIRSLSVTLAVPILLIGLLGTCQSVDWRDFKEEYGLVYYSEYRHYRMVHAGAANGFTGKFEMNGTTHELPVFNIVNFLYTNDSIPYWWSTVSMTIQSHMYGGPFKISMLDPVNCSITVVYLGDKFDPLCNNLNCQHECVIPRNTDQKRELVDPNRWGAFQAIIVPVPKKILGAMTYSSDEDLECKLISKK